MPLTKNGNDHLASALEAAAAQARGDKNSTSSERANTVENAPTRNVHQDDGMNTPPVNAYEEVADPLSQFYRNVATTVPPNYTLAPGDTVNIRFWSSRIEARTVTLAVSGQGTVALDMLGPMTVRGMTLDQMEKALKTSLAKLYNGVEVAATLTKLRTIQITVTGEAYQTGTYAVPAIATFYNMLYWSGGPTEEGSLRQIELRRQGKTIATMDIYAFLQGGTEAKDVALQSGDLLYIPPHQSRVAVYGEVKRPSFYEINPKETLKEALRFAGGVRESGIAQRVQIRTVVPSTDRVLKDVDVREETAQTTPLYDKDEVEVFSLREGSVNEVSIEGAIDQPGQYALSPGMRTSELIRKARGVMPDAYLTRADVFRTNPDNTTTMIPLNIEKAMGTRETPEQIAADVPLQRWDRVKIYTRQEVAYTGQRQVTISGAVTRPGVYTRSNTLHLSDLLRLAGGPTPEAFLDRAVLLHQNGNGTYDYQFLNLHNLLIGTEPDTLLLDNDRLMLYKTGEAQFEPEHVVTLRGEVVAPGVFPRGKGMRLSDLFKVSGGLKPGGGTRVVIAHVRRSIEEVNATLKTMTLDFVSREMPTGENDVLLEDGDMVTVQGNGALQSTIGIVTVQGAVNFPGPIVMNHKKMRVSDVLKAAGGLRPEAFPQAAEFYRNSKLLMTSNQRTLLDSVMQLNDLINEDTAKRQRARSYIEHIKAAGVAVQGVAPLPATGQQDTSVQNASSVALAEQLFKYDLLTPGRKLTSAQMAPSGALAINVPSAIKYEGGVEDLMLEDGDTILIPETPTTVQVIGAVTNGRAIPYRPGLKVEDYVTQSGGFTVDVAKDRIIVIHAGGGIIPMKKAGAIQPGDVILVPTRVMAEKLDRYWITFDGVFRAITSSAIVFKLAQQLFRF